MATLYLAAAPRGRSPRGRNHKVPQDREPARARERWRRIGCWPRFTATTRTGGGSAPPI
jgi:hypothetical protein